jgi:hypothetical protein
MPTKTPSNSQKGAPATRARKFKTSGVPSPRVSSTDVIKLTNELPQTKINSPEALAGLYRGENSGKV